MCYLRVREQCNVIIDGSYTLRAFHSMKIIIVSTKKQSATPIRYSLCKMRITILYFILCVYIADQKYFADCAAKPQEVSCHSLFNKTRVEGGVELMIMVWELCDVE